MLLEKKQNNRKNIISLIPESQKVMPVCGNKDKGAQVMKMCKVGCIGCMKCQRTRNQYVYGHTLTQLSCSGITLHALQNSKSRAC